MSSSDCRACSPSRSGWSGQIVVEESAADGDLAAGFGHFPDDPRLGVPGAAGLPAVGRGRRDVHALGELPLGEVAERPVVGCHFITALGEVLHGEHVAVQLVGDRHVAELQGPEEAEVDGRPSSRRSNSSRADRSQ